MRVFTKFVKKISSPLHENNPRKAMASSGYVREI